jgi:hypothetical protein
MGSVATTATVNATITRSQGSFLDEGWRIGQHVMLDNATSTVNNGNPVAVTGVSALTLTLNGVSAVSVAEPQGVGFRLIRVAQIERVTIPLNAGNADGVPSVRLFNNGMDPRNDTSGLFLGERDVLIMGLASAVSALPAAIHVHVTRGLY